MDSGLGLRYDVSDKTDTKRTAPRKRSHGTLQPNRNSEITLIIGYKPSTDDGYHEEDHTEAVERETEAADVVEKAAQKWTHREADTAACL